MIKVAYNINSLNKLTVIKQARVWWKSGIIDKQQWAAIQAMFKCDFFSPNIFIRIVLFIAALIALSGVTALVALPFMSSEELYSTASIIYGVGSLFLLDLVFIKRMKHYKSGVTEALLYHAIGFTLFGFSLLFDFNLYVLLVAGILVFSFSAIRYLDLLSTVAAILCTAYLLFYFLFDMGGIFKQLIPFAFILFFLGVYFFAKKILAMPGAVAWENCLLLVKAFSLLFIYAGGNYLVVRELSILMMDLTLEPGADIPFAFIFYSLTVLLPVIYIFFGVRRKNIVLLRSGVVAFFFSVFTFKYYYSLGHPEITLTLAGLILIGLAIFLLNYLRVIRYGYTREKLIAENWESFNAEAFVIAQTMGGNVGPASGNAVEFGDGGGFDGGGVGKNF